MRLEYEKHTVKTNWFKQIIEGVLVIIGGTCIAIVVISILFGLTYTITQWGKG